MAAAATLSILAVSKSSIVNADTRWLNQHLTTSVVEFYLLGGPNASLPASLLPNGYSASCETFIVDDIPEEALEPIQNWLLAEFVITLYGPNGDLISETHVRKLLKEADFE